MKAAQVIVGFRIDPAADDHLLEDLRSSGAEHLSLRGIVGYIGFCRVADVLGNDSEFLGREVPPASGIPASGFSQGLNGADLG